VPKQGSNVSAPASVADASGATHTGNVSAASNVPAATDASNGAVS
jgi:hypothetical protein